ATHWHAEFYSTALAATLRPARKGLPRPPWRDVHPSTPGARRRRAWRGWRALERAPRHLAPGGCRPSPGLRAPRGPTRAGHPRGQVQKPGRSSRLDRNTFRVSPPRPPWLGRPLLTRPTGPGLVRWLDSAA